MNISETNYPWYCLVNGDELQQGDILEGCPIFSPPTNLTLNSLYQEANFRWTQRNVIIMSQTCDMVKGRKGITEVLLCLITDRSEHTDPNDHLSTPVVWNELEKDNLSVIMC